MRNEKLMGFWSVLGLTIGAQLGTGMFLLPSQLAPYGFWGAASWILTGSGALVLALIFAHLSLHMPNIGGPHVYVERAFGKQAAFCTGWTYWMISWISSIPVIVVYAGALEHLCGPFTPSMRLFLEIGTILVIMFLNIRGALISGIGEIFFSILKVAPLLLIPLLALVSAPLHPLPFPEKISTFSAIHQASLLGFWGYIGLECATTVSNCVKNPKVTIGRALFFGSLLVTLLYVLNVTVILGVVPEEILLSSASPYSELLTHFCGPIGGKIMSVLIAIMCLGTLNSWLLTSGQIAVVAAKEKLFPTFFVRGEDNDSPIASILLTTALLIVCIILLQNHSLRQQLDLLINFSVSLFIAVYLLCVLSFFALLKKKVLPFSYPALVLGLLGLGFCLWVLSGVNMWMLLGAMSIPASGFVLRALFRW